MRSGRERCVGMALLLVGLAACGTNDPPPEFTDGLDCDGSTTVSSYLDYPAGEAPASASAEEAAREAVSGSAFKAEDSSPSSTKVRVFVERDGLAVKYVDVRQDSSGQWTADSITSCVD